jgi:hypothetical protein
MVRADRSVAVRNGIKIICKIKLAFHTHIFLSKVVIPNTIAITERIKTT